MTKPKPVVRWKATAERGKSERARHAVTSFKVGGGSINKDSLLTVEISFDRLEAFFWSSPRREVNKRAPDVRGEVRAVHSTRSKRRETAHEPRKSERGRDRQAQREDGDEMRRHVSQNKLRVKKLCL